MLTILFILFQDKTWQKVYPLAEESILSIFGALDTNLLTLNIKKTKQITFYKTVAPQPPSHLTIKYHTCYNHHQSSPRNATIHYAIQYLGITLDETLSFKAQIQSLSGKVRKHIFLMKKLRDYNFTDNICILVCTSQSCKKDAEPRC